MWNFVRRTRQWLWGKSRSKSRSASKAKRPPRDPATYWAERRDMAYYREVIRLAREFAPRAQSAVDVGPNGTPLLCELDWIPSKTAIDLVKAEIPGVTSIQGDFFHYQPEQLFDLVLCLQVLEHVPLAEAFARKLLETGKTVIISVPFCWPEHFCPYHVHDPVDREKLLGWTGKACVTDLVVRDRGHDRLIAVFEGASGAAQRRAA